MSDEESSSEQGNVQRGSGRGPASRTNISPAARNTGMTFLSDRFRDFEPAKSTLPSKIASEFYKVIERDFFDEMNWGEPNAGDKPGKAVKSFLDSTKKMVNNLIPDTLVLKKGVDITADLANKIKAVLNNVELKIPGDKDNEKRSALKEFVNFLVQVEERKKGHKYAKRKSAEDEGKEAQADAFEGDLDGAAHGVKLVRKLGSGDIGPKRHLEELGDDKDDDDDGDGDNGDVGDDSDGGSAGRKASRRASRIARKQRGKKDSEALAELQANRLQHEAQLALDNRKFLESMSLQTTQVLQSVQQSNERVAQSNAQALQAQAAAAQAQAQAMAAAAQAQAQAAQAQAQAMTALAAVLQKFGPQ